MIRSKHLEKLSSVQPTGPAQPRHRLGLASQRSTAAPSRRQTAGTLGLGPRGISNNTTDITLLPALHLTPTALAVRSATVTVDSHRRLTTGYGLLWLLGTVCLTPGVVAARASTQCGSSGQYGPHSIPPASLASSPSPTLRSVACRLSPVAVSATTDTPAGSPYPSPAPRLSPVASAPPRPKGGPIRSRDTKGKRATQRLPS